MGASRAVMGHWGIAQGQRIPSHMVGFIQSCLDRRRTLWLEESIGVNIYGFSATPISDEQCVNLYATNITRLKETETETDLGQGGG